MIAITDITDELVKKFKSTDFFKDFKCKHKAFYEYGYECNTYDDKIFRVSWRMKHGAYGYVIDNFSANIGIISLENLLFKVLNKNKLPPTTKICTLSIPQLLENKDVYKQLSKIEIDIPDEDELEKYISLFGQCLKDVIIPFFEKYSLIEGINELIEMYSSKECEYFFMSRYDDYKKLIIMKWANNPKYASYRDSTYKYYEKYAIEYGGENINEFNALKDLIKELEKND